MAAETFTLPLHLVADVERHVARRRITVHIAFVEALSLWCELEMLGPMGRDREDARRARPEDGRAAGRGRLPAAARTAVGRPRTPRRDTDASTAPRSPAPNSEQADLPRVVRPRSRPPQTLGLNAANADRKGGSGRTHHHPV